jgi:hypothetical protein
MYNLQCDCGATKTVAVINLNCRCYECEPKVDVKEYQKQYRLVHKTKTVYKKKKKSIRFTDSESDEPDTIIDYYEPSMTFVEIAKELNISTSGAKKLYDSGVAKIKAIM